MLWLNICATLSGCMPNGRGVSVQAPRLIDLAQRYGTPLWVYDAAIIREQIARLRPFDVIRYAQKASANLHLLRLMRAEGVLVDAVSLGEIERASRAGYTVQPGVAELVFTADLFDRSTLDRVIAALIPVNAGSIDMLEQLGERAPGHPVWLRINPGFGHGHSRKTNTGGIHSKHGIWYQQLEQAAEVIRRHRLQLVGLHMHIGSGSHETHLERVCTAMVACAKRIAQPFQAISAGGGLTVPYTQGAPAVDIAKYFAAWDRARKQIEQQLGYPITLEVEPGRFLVAKAGVLVSEVRATKSIGSKHFVLLDAGFNDLMRPAMYGSYHAISLIAQPGQPKAEALRPTIVAGPVCESSDVFTQDQHARVAPRMLPPMRVGDYVLLHDAGAYGASMSSNYNSRPLIPEILIDGKQSKLIRRRQTLAELLSLEDEDPAKEVTHVNG
jgi:diaminopimelate decarboxylase